MNERETQVVRRELLAWYGTQQRELPWRGTRDPYRIWVSEIMLQQTRAETVIPYYRAFLSDWPDVRTLADADLSRVLKRWEGLGYYSRARNLHRAAQVVAHELDGAFPSDAAGLRELPGIGEYTSGMIASIAYNECAPAIDGNQIRVLSRLLYMDRPARAREGMAALRAYALALIDREHPGDFNQALMDLAQSICKPRRPDCARCPISENCIAYAKGDAGRLPILPKRAPQRMERHGVAIVVSGGKVWVKRRPETGLLGGLYVFPHFLDANSVGSVAEILEENGICATYSGESLDVQHIFTHLIWQQTAFGFFADVCDGLNEGEWVDVRKLNELPMTAAHFGFREMAIRMMGADGK